MEVLKGILGKRFESLLIMDDEFFDKLLRNHDAHHIEGKVTVQI